MRSSGVVRVGKVARAEATMGGASCIEVSEGVVGVARREGLILETAARIEAVAAIRSSYSLTNSLAFASSLSVFHMSSSGP